MSLRARIAALVPAIGRKDYGRKVDRVRRAARAAVEALERRQLLTVSWSGYVFIDDNENGTRDAGEQGVAGYTVSWGMFGQYGPSLYGSDGGTVQSGSGGAYTVTSNLDFDPETVQCRVASIAVSGDESPYLTTDGTHPAGYYYLDDHPGPYDFGLAPRDPHLPPPPPGTTHAKDNATNSRTCTECGDDGVSPYPVRYADGLMVEQSTDLPSMSAVPWGHDRSWTNSPQYAGEAQNGNGWVVSQWPSLAKSYDGAAVAWVIDGNDAEWFDGTTTFAARHNSRDTLTLSSGEYVLTTEAGEQYRFYDFSTSLPSNQRGSFKGYRDAAGNEVTAHAHDGDGNLTEARHSVTANSVTTVESFLYDYLTSGANDGRLERVTYRTSTNAGSTWTTVRKAEYAYYEGTGTGEDAFGTLGDLKTAVVKDGAGTVLDTTYYRYYPDDTSSDGYAGGLQFVLYADDYARAAAGLTGGTTPFNATAEELAPFASRHYTYDAAHRVSAETVGGAGGGGTYQFAYETSGHADGYNSWKYKTTETLPDGNQNVVYTNHLQRVMLKVFRNTATSQEWLDYTQYDAAGRPVLTAGPSAVSGYWEASPDLLTDPGEPADAELEGLRDAEGLITTTTYGASNAATSTVAGDALGQVKSVSVRQGEAGTPVKQQEYTYLQRTGGSVTTYPAATSTVYRNDNGTGGQTTTFAYTWFSGTVQPQTVTTTLPTVTTAQNGSNAAAAVVTVLDPYGRPVWMRDADGFISYTEYDAATGAVTKAIADVATSLVSNEPSGWTTPAGGGRHLVTEFEVDRLGRTTKVTDPTGTLTYVVYKDADREVRTYRGFVATTSTSGTVAGPVEVTREDRGNKYTETLTMSPTVAVSGSRPTGGETIANVQSLARTFVNDLGQVSETRVYTSMPAGGYSTSPSLGTAGANYLVTEYGYDARGRQNRVATPDGTKRRTLYDGLGRVASTWVGTDDSYATDTYAGGNMVMVTENTYDAGGVGDSNLTLARTYGDSASYDAVFGYDWRNRGTDRRGPDGVATKATLDNLGQVTTTETYADADADFVIDSGELRGKGEAAYDERGRVYQAVVHEVSPTTGSIGHRLTTKYWYDARGNTVKTADPNGLFNKTRYDGTGLATATFLSFDTAETAYADADDVTGDMVVEQHKTIFDKDDNAVTTVAYSRLDGDTTTNGELTAGNSYVQVAVNWYDTLGRPTGAATYGRDNGLTRYVFNTSNALIDADSDGLPDEAEGSARTPNSSDDYIVSKTEYDAAGRAYRSTDNKGHVTQRVLDLAGRTLKTVENYVDGTAAETETEADRTTETVYDASGRVDKLVAYNPKGLGNGVEHQETKYLYESTVDGSWVTSTIYPDSADTDSSGTDQVKSTLDRLGRATTTTDQRGVVHTYTYDAAGRLETDAVTTLPSGVDGSIRRIDTAYDDLSRPRLVTSYAEDYGSTVVNEFQNTYDGWGNVAKSEQAHDGPVTTGTPAVEYTYEDGAVSGEAKYVRLSKVTYPNGRQVHYNLPSDTIGQKLVRLGNIAADGSGTTKYAAYTYLGAGAVTTVTHPAVSGGLTLSYGSAGTYAGWDRFGRTVLQQWKDGSGTVLDGFAYTYGRDSNRLSRTPTAAGAPAALTEQYSYDGLGRLVETRRGTPGTSGHISTPDQLWTYRLDVQGNQWQYITATSPTPGDVNLDGRINASDKSRVQGAMGRSEGIRWTDGDVDEDGVVTSADLAIVQGLSGYSGGNAGVTQDRTHDAANEITGTSGNSPAWAATAYDAAGNMTAGPKSQEETTLLHRTYDGWNRLTGVFADDGYGAAATQLVAYEHDGRGFRIERTEDPAGTPARDDLYYNEGWQVLEVRRDGDTDPREQWVWDPRYVDAAVVRFLDANLDGDVADVGDSTLYPTQDANFNVTGLVNASTGSVVERYAYDPYGEVTVLDANFTPDADGVSDCTWNILYQGRKWDALTHDYDARNREYSSSIGRWTQRDPQGYVDGMSLYENVMSRPTGLTDPYGTDSHSGTIALDANPSGFTISRFEGAEHTFFQIPKMQVEVDFTMNGDQPDWPLLITGVRPTGKLPDLSAVYSIDDRIATDQNNFGVRAAAKRVFTNVVISFVVKVQRKLARDLTGKVCVRYRFSGGWKVTAQETRRSGNQQETVTVESRITFPDPLEPNEMILDGRKPPKNRRVPDMRDARWEDYREEVIELKRGPVPATQPTTRPATQPAPQPPKPAGGQGNAPRRRPAAATRPG